MKISHFKFMTMVSASLLLAACGAKTAEYYAAHPDEALQALKACQPRPVNEQLADATCVNAGQGYRTYLVARNKAIREGERKAMQEWVDQNKR
ncbi:EexN family lipoprotein [Polaromonas sp. CT11-55]|uniref:EexN family lipoprotein n=1 Tax=Polaromonas sp. CT11-55 TaxID=3243045 RepID=UPI0039A5229C